MPVVLTERSANVTFALRHGLRAYSRFALASLTVGAASVAQGQLRSPVNAMVDWAVPSISRDSSSATRVRLGLSTGLLYFNYKEYFGHTPWALDRYIGTTPAIAASIRVTSGSHRWFGTATYSFARGQVRQTDLDQVPLRVWYGGDLALHEGTLALGFTPLRTPRNEWSIGPAYFYRMWHRTIRNAAAHPTENYTFTAPGYRGEWQWHARTAVTSDFEAFEGWTIATRMVGSANTAAEFPAETLALGSGRPVWRINEALTYDLSARLRLSLALTYLHVTFGESPSLKLPPPHIVEWEPRSVTHQGAMRVGAQVRF